MLVNGFQAKTTSQSLSVFNFQIKSFITCLADSILLGLRSSASILHEISSAKTISIQFFLIFSTTFDVFGLAKIKIKLKKIKVIRINFV